MQAEFVAFAELDLECRHKWIAYVKYSLQLVEKKRLLRLISFDRRNIFKAGILEILTWQRIPFSY